MYDRVCIPAKTKIIRYDASVDANPIAAVRILYQRIIDECGYTTNPEKQKQVWQHLEESFLKPEQLLKSALKSLKLFKNPVRSADKTMITDQLLKTIHDYLVEGCGILKGEISSRTPDNGAAQKALSQLITLGRSGPRITDPLINTMLPMLSRELSILMSLNPKVLFADQPSLPKKVDLTRPSGGGSGGGGADANTLTP